MNKKEKRLIEIFEDAARMAREHSNDSVWFFLGAITSKLARETLKGEEVKGIYDIHLEDEHDNLVEILNNIIKTLR